MLRLTLAIMLLSGIAGTLVSSASTGTALGTVAVALSLALGFLTPGHGRSVHRSQAGPVHGADGRLRDCSTLRLLVALAVGMLGPGAYSLDAMMLGRRKVVTPTIDDSKKD
jgi:hypothetical protein